MQVSPRSSYSDSSLPPPYGLLQMVRWASLSFKSNAWLYIVDCIRLVTNLPSVILEWEIIVMPNDSLAT